MFKDTTATKKIFQLKKRIRAVCGGTSASKTVSILIWLIDYAQSTQGKLVSVVSESFPHLSGGAMLDFERIMKDRGYWNDLRLVKTPRYTYTFETGSKIEFITVDTYGKAHGPRRDVLFMNECNNLPFNIADQLITRTRDIVWLDWNPTNEFWFYTEMQGKRDDIDFITLTYLDNEALDEGTKKEIESRRHRKGWWQVYGLGQLVEVEGKIYKDWQIIDEIPHEARLEGYGLDFGYDPDPAAIVAVYYYNGGYILDEILYQRQVSNPELATMFKNMPRGLVLADSAEPKSIDEIKSFGISILGAEKGKWSVRYGVKTLQNQRISVTKRSVNLIKEYRNYFQAIDRRTNIQIMGEYDGECHALDATRYKLCSLIPFKKRQERLAQLPREMPRPRFNPAV